jgi:hypothetical protein
MTVLEGGCHCGNLRFALTTDLDPASLEPRACDCSFCRKHATRALSDPAGALKLSARDGSELGRYRFGTGFTDFLICRRCGVYIGAFMPDGSQSDAGEPGYANVMAGTLDRPDLIVRPPAAVHRSSEAPDAKRARRRANWTPATLTIGC